jgi:hypothetical protein
MKEYRQKLISMIKETQSINKNSIQKFNDRVLIIFREIREIIKELESLILDSKILDTLYWILYIGYFILDTLYC